MARHKCSSSGHSRHIYQHNTLMDQTQPCATDASLAKIEQSLSVSPAPETAARFFGAGVVQTWLHNNTTNVPDWPAVLSRSPSTLSGCACMDKLLSITDEKDADCDRPPYGPGIMYTSRRALEY
jgi:hypothetical protein